MTRGGWHFGQSIDFSSALYIKSTAAAYAVLSMTQMANLLQAPQRKTFRVRSRIFQKQICHRGDCHFGGMLLSFLHIPFFQRYLHMAPIDGWDWLVVAGATLAVFLFEEARKAEEK